VLRRANWLRFLLIVVYALGSVVILAASRTKASVPPLLYLHAAVQAGIMVLLLLPRTSVWFGEKGKR
jgi:hypothetical protein